MKQPSRIVFKRNLISRVIVKQTYYLLLEISTEKRLEPFPAGHLNYLIQIFSMIIRVRFLIGNHQLMVTNKAFYIH